MKNQIQEGTRVLLRETEWAPLQKATVLGIDDEVITFAIDREDREEDDLDGLVEGSLEDIQKVLS